MKNDKTIENKHALGYLEQFKKTGDQNDLVQFYQPFMRMVLAIGFKYYKDQMKAEDLVMNVYEILLKKASTHSVTNVSSWIYSIAKNECLMTLRKKKREFSVEDFNFTAQAMESEQVLHLFNENKEEKNLHALNDCIEQLNENQKLCIKAFYLKKETYKQVSENLNFDLKKVKSLIQNGKRNLKNCMESKK